MGRVNFIQVGEDRYRRKTIWELWRSGWRPFGKGGWRNYGTNQWMTWKEVFFLRTYRIFHNGSTISKYAWRYMVDGKPILVADNFMIKIQEKPYDWVG